RGRCLLALPRARPPHPPARRRRIARPGHGPRPALRPRPLPVGGRPARRRFVRVSITARTLPNQPPEAPRSQAELGNENPCGFYLTVSSDSVILRPMQSRDPLWTLEELSA